MTVGEAGAAELLRLLKLEFPVVKVLRLLNSMSHFSPRSRGAAFGKSRTPMM
jgi:hypothetical protein